MERWSYDVVVAGRRMTMETMEHGCWRVFVSGSDHSQFQPFPITTTVGAAHNTQAQQFRAAQRLCRLRTSRYFRLIGVLSELRGGVHCGGQCGEVQNLYEIHRSVSLSSCKSSQSPCGAGSSGLQPQRPHLCLAARHGDGDGDGDGVAGALLV